jgi:adenylate cyclase
VEFLKRLVRVTPFKLSLAITLFFVAISFLYDINPKLLSLIAVISEKSLDYKFELRGARPPKSKIVIVSGDDKSFTKFGQWPFDRGTVFAPLLETLCHYNPKAVGLDIVWSEPEKTVPGGVKAAIASEMGAKSSDLDDLLRSHSGDSLLRKAIESCSGKLVMGYAFDDNNPIAKADFDKRTMTIVESGHNILSGISRGRIKYGRHRFDGEANVSFYFMGRAGLFNYPTLIPSGTAQGFFNNEGDSDGNYRHAVFFYRVQDRFVPSLALRMAQKALNPADAPASVFISPDSAQDGLSQELRLELNTPAGNRKVPIDPNGQAIVNFRGPNRTFPNVSMADVVNDSDTIEYDVIEAGVEKHYKEHKSEFFKDALVLVGITAQALYDIRPRPFDSMAAGVENHASILDNLLNDDFLVRPTSDLVLWLILAILGLGLGYGWVVAKLDAKWGTVFALSTVGGLLYFDQVYLFNNRGIVFSGHLQALQLLLQYLSITALKYMNEENEKRFIRSAFDKYVSPAIIDTMLKDPRKLKLGGDKKELTVLFSDIRSFTELSERMDVKALTHFLNQYLGTMTDILQKNNGTLDKYIGDAVMGFWGAPIDLPNHASLAVRTAVDMITKLEELNVEFQKEYGLTIDIGIGINSGPVSVGNFGSNKVFEYTVIGDNVNLASRLEGVNKYYGTRIIISETTHDLLKPEEFLCREVDTVKVKGKQKPVKIYEVFPDTQAYAPLKTVLKTFNEGLMHYYARQFEKALSFFQTVLQTKDGDRPTLELIERCRHYIVEPPEKNWDGSWEMHSK